MPLLMPRGFWPENNLPKTLACALLALASRDKNIDTKEVSNLTKVFTFRLHFV